MKVEYNVTVPSFSSHFIWLSKHKKAMIFPCSHVLKKCKRHGCDERVFALYITSLCCQMLCQVKELKKKCHPHSGPYEGATWWNRREIKISLQDNYGIMYKPLKVNELSREDEWQF